MDPHNPPTLLLDPITARQFIDRGGFDTKGKLIDWVYAQARLPAGEYWDYQLIQNYVYPRATFGEEPYAAMLRAAPEELIPMFKRDEIHVVVVGGETVAETRRPRLLFETNLPTRYYIPKLDVRMDLLEATHTVTHCPSGQTRWGGGSTGPAEPGREHPDTVVLRRHSRCGLSHPPVPGGRGTDVRGFQRHGRRHAQ